MKIQVHFFESTGEAYNACQCDENIKNGDVLVIEFERVVGLAYTWPVAITSQYGNLHTIAEGKTLEADFADVFTARHLRAARAIAKHWGYT